MGGVSQWGERVDWSAGAFSIKTNWHMSDEKKGKH
jgi:hypothetical protein